MHGISWQCHQSVELGCTIRLALPSGSPMNSSVSTSELGLLSSFASSFSFTSFDPFPGNIPYFSQSIAFSAARTSSFSFNFSIWSLKTLAFLALTRVTLLSNCCSICCSPSRVHEPRFSPSSFRLETSRSSIFFSIFSASVFRCCHFSQCA